MACSLLLTGGTAGKNFKSGRTHSSSGSGQLDAAGNLIVESPGPAPEETAPAEPETAPAEPAPRVQTPVLPPSSPAPAAAEGAAPVLPPAETVLLEDDLPLGASPEGTWIWDSENFISGIRSHSHPPGKGLHSHGFRLEKPVPIPSGGMITQQVWLDPKDPPQGIALKLTLATGEEIGVYWEAEQEVFKPNENQELWYYGPLPELGKWAELDVLAEDLGLDEGEITGVRFVTFGGRVLWDRTAVTMAPPIEEASKLLESPAELRPSVGKKSPE